MRRSPAVAQQFYPGNPDVLRNTLHEFIPQKTQKLPTLAVISPHAGYMYSGGVAGETFSRVDVPRDVVIMGPNHHGLGARVALMDHGVWAMPLGDVPINEELAGDLARESTEIESDELAHRYEHSLEVQVPFLQYLREGLQIVPLVVSHIPYSTCEKVGRDIAAAVKRYDRPVLIVASSDMTHYESREQATRKDMSAIERITALDPSGLYETVTGQGITMCGIMPAAIAMVAALELGASRAELVRYTDSGAATGDTAQVVGYAGIVIG